MTFTDNLRFYTKETHSIVDKHQFVSLIKINKNSGKIYVNFNKLCINVLQNKMYQKQDFKEIYKKLYRHIEPLDLFISDNLLKLLNRCEKYPLEHCYMFYLGIIKGGNLLTKYLPEYKLFFKYENSNELVKEFKDYLDNNIDTKEKQEKFIKIVNESYSIIKLVFDNFLEKHNSFEKIN